MADMANDGTKPEFRALWVTRFGWPAGGNVEEMKTAKAANGSRID